MKSARTWIDGFTAFFETVTESLPQILDAAKCREAWLQAECFRFFRERGDCFYVNTEPLPREDGKLNDKADFSSYESDADDAAITMIGELKLLGTSGYQSKMFCGGPIGDLVDRLDRDRRLLLDAAEVQDRVAGGLLRDYVRLKNYRQGERLPRLLILVLDTRAKEPDSLGRLLQAVELERRATVLAKTDAFLGKCWSLGA